MHTARFNQTPASSDEPPSGEPAPNGTKQWQSDQLFGGAHEVGIRHQGHLYRLRRTKLGKLILTK